MLQMKILKYGKNIEGMLLPKNQWTTINRIRTGTGKMWIFIIQMALQR